MDQNYIELIAPAFLAVIAILRALKGHQRIGSVIVAVAMVATIVLNVLGWGDVAAIVSFAGIALAIVLIAFQFWRRLQSGGTQ
jgi:hypothetical protein